MPGLANYDCVICGNFMEELRYSGNIPPEYIVCPRCSNPANMVQFAPDATKDELEGRKDDQQKPRYDLIAPELLESVARVLTFGAEKYGERNWEQGMSWGRPFAALMRHMWAWWRGESNDPETGLPHLAHAACCVMFLLAYEQRNIGKDNRPSQE